MGEFVCNSLAAIGRGVGFAVVVWGAGRIVIELLGQAEDPGVSLGTVLKIGGLIITPLIGAIGILWRLHLGNNKTTDERLSKSEVKNEELQNDLVKVKTEVGRVDGRQQGIEAMCNVTMRTVHNAIAGRPYEEPDIDVNDSGEFEARK